MSQKIIQESFGYVLKLLKDNLDEKFYYHNVAHTQLVYESAKLLAQDAELGEEDSTNLILAATFHDTGFIRDPKNHEQESAKIAEAYLSEKEVNPAMISRIQELILATQLSWEGDDQLCLILRDADMSGLAQRNYLEIAESLRKEENWRNDKQVSSVDWIQENVKFIGKHQYLSKVGQKRFGKSKKKNLKKLKALANQNKPLTIANSKSAQTQLKTALRNHIDLSAIADNKANIMLSVNAIVITVGLPLLVDRSMGLPELQIPTLILAITSVVSMIFATLSTRPAKMPGLTSIESIENKKSNLFFFGNFYKMNFDDYDQGMSKVVGDNSNLDKAITRDLFYLGKSLGIKYERLRLCYNIFMIGIVASVLSYVIVMMMN
jgi:predicted metal-dependent HD superfamily phosphohydrolase